MKLVRKNSKIEIYLGHRNTHQMSTLVHAKFLYFHLSKNNKCQLQIFGLTSHYSKTFWYNNVKILYHLSVFNHRKDSFVHRPDKKYMEMYTVGKLHTRRKSKTIQWINTCIDTLVCPCLTIEKICLSTDQKNIQGNENVLWANFTLRENLKPVNESTLELMHSFVHC